MKTYISVNGVYTITKTTKGVTTAGKHKFFKNLTTLNYKMTVFSKKKQDRKATVVLQSVLNIDCFISTW